MSFDRLSRRGLLLLTSPGLLVITVLLLFPVGWLFTQSYVGPDSAFTLENYTRLANPLYVATFVMTFKVSAVVTLFAILLGYPTAYLISVVRPRWALFCIIVVILPFWTSVLVRAYAWLVLLQRRGLINRFLMDIGVIDEPLRLVHNFSGTIIGMVHIMLPFVILPIYASIKSLDVNLYRAALSCGASPFYAFWRVVFPLTLPGLFAGAVLVFISSLGYYTTPSLLGGGRINMIAMQIETNLSLYGDWGAASALGVVLIVVTTVLLAMFYYFPRFTHLRGNA